MVPAAIQQGCRRAARPCNTARAVVGGKPAWLRELGGLSSPNEVAQCDIVGEVHLPKPTPLLRLVHRAGPEAVVKVWSSSRCERLQTTTKAAHLNPHA
jgi:hypothetical protein